MEKTKKSKFINTSINLNKEVHDLMMEYQKQNRLRNKSFTIEILLLKALEMEGFKLD